MYNILYILLHINTSIIIGALGPKEGININYIVEMKVVGPTIMYNILYILLHIKPSIIIGALGPKEGIHIYYIMEMKVGP